MKKISLLLLVVSVFVFFTACEDDSTTDPPVNTATVYEATELIRAFDDIDYTINQIRVQDLGEGTGTTTWTSDNVYILDGFVFVNEGQTLTIEAGTIIKGQSGQGENASALIVARGATIEANGTADDPIVFTSEADDLARANDGTLLEGTIFLDETPKGLWGGVIILGNASLNSVPGETAIEGLPTTEVRGLYGGTDDADNSGTFRYASIRYGGTDIGEGNEINGLTMGGVGSGTTIEYVEVFANKDDGFEWFGGTVGTKYLIAALCGDDAMDYDEGWRGENQWWFIYQDADGDNGGEHDGGTDPETAEPFAIPVITNATFVGGESTGSTARRALRFRDNAGGKYISSIFEYYEDGVEIECLGATEQDSYQQFQDGNLEFVDNVVANIVNDFFIITNDCGSEVYYFDQNNSAATTGLTDACVPTGNFTSNVDASQYGTTLTNTSYRGAFDPNSGSRWIDGWSLISTIK